LRFEYPFLGGRSVINFVYFMGRDETAIPILSRHLAAYPNMLTGQLALTVAYAELGRDEDAQAQAAEIMRISPRFTVAPP